MDQIRVSIKHVSPDRIIVGIFGIITAKLDLIRNDTYENEFCSLYFSANGDEFLNLSHRSNALTISMFKNSMSINVENDRIEKHKDQIHIIEIDDYHHLIDGDDKCRVYYDYYHRLFISCDDDTIHQILGSGVITDGKLDWFIRHTMSEFNDEETELSYSDLPGGYSVKGAH
jgi:hypothetical protein